MNFFNWFKPGIRVKRWIVMGMLGLIVSVLGMARVLLRIPIMDKYMILYFYLGFLGIVVLYASMKLGLRSILSLLSGVNMNTNINRQVLSDLLYEQRFLVRGPKIVAIGGGTGLSTMLRGLKEYTSNITAIVTVADDGGGSGVLSESLGMLPPGDIRNCLVALAHTEPLMEELMQYRFTDGNLKGQSFGNLFIAAMNGISSNFEEAIKKMSEVLAVKGRVFPVTLEDVVLCARLLNGNTVKGESNIPKQCIDNKTGIKGIYIEPTSPKPHEDALFAIDDADCIIIGPGSLYTSILPNLIIPEVSDRIRKSGALKIYVSNIMTQPGETEGYDLSDHIHAIKEHCGDGIIDFAIANIEEIPVKYYEKYKNDGQEIVKIDYENIPDDVQVIAEELVNIKDDMLRHDTRMLSIAVMKLILKYVIPKNKRRIVDLYYLSERVKEKQREMR